MNDPAGARGRGACRRLEPEALIHACQADRLAFADTDALEPLEGPLGQARVADAIAFATGIERSGYNLFVMGSAGIGRHHLLRQALGDVASEREPPADWCYVADFDHPDRPRAMALPAGRGAAFRDDMRRWLEELLTALPAAFQSDAYRHRAREIQDEFKQREDSTAEGLGRHAAQRGVALVSTPTGYSLVPMKDGKLLDPKEYEALPDQEREQRQQAMQELKEELRNALGRIPAWKRELAQRLRELETEVTGATVAELLGELERRYADLPGVLDYLAAAGTDVVAHVAPFLADEGGEGPAADDPRFTRYRVNLLVDNGGATGAPVVYEDNPNYQNLLGRIEHVAHLGTLSTDFTLIKPGALHRANGGYLVLDVERVLAQPFAWSALKRALTSGEIRIESADRLVGLMQTVSLEPQPVPLDVKVALVGERVLYYLLEAYDPDFVPLFKVIGDFNEDMRRDAERETAYARLVATLQRGEGLRAFERDAVARIVDWSARRAGDGEKVSLHLGSLVQLMQEADHFAALALAERVAADHVQVAIDKRIERADQLRQRLHDAILRDAILIDTGGRQLGRVNGLVVIDAGDHPFGSPTRISATARMGGGEVVDIESEADLGGSIHGKGVMILSAYLANRYARHQPLSLAASLVFEQSYGSVEGDSASLGELCALLSAIGDLSVDQSLAVTGSVNQHGQVQAVGGVNEKIEGFFDICRARGLSGHQGVVIPQANVRDLMLRGDVREAVAAGRFHVYAAEHADQVMALLTGMPAGTPDANGLYPQDSCNGRVQIRLIEWTAMRQHYAAGANLGDSN